MSMRVDLYSICWNEARMLPFFFRHYDAFVDRYIFYDDGSTDGTREILAAHPGVELRRFPRVVADSFVDSARRLHDSVWRESRGRADWVIITPVDEHLGHPDMPGLLVECRRHGVTAVPALGFQMVAERFPDGAGRLADTLRLGAPHPPMSKLSLFNPDAIEATNFLGGRHSAAPTGRVVYPDADTLANLHYRYLGLDYLQSRHELLRTGLGSGDAAAGFGAEYHRDTASLRADWEGFRARAVDYADPAQDTAATHPARWWRRAASVEPSPAPAVAANAVNLVTIRPPGWVHAAATDDVAASLRYGLALSGVAVTRSDNQLLAGRLNLVLGAHLSGEPELFARPQSNAVVFNTLALVPEVLAAQPGYAAMLPRLRVWEDSPANLRTLAALGCRDARHVPLGYAPSMTRLEPYAEPEIDVLFYGAETPRRLRIWQRFARSGLRLAWAHASYGAERDRLLRASRLVLNMHAHEESVLETGRILYPLANRMVVISERTPRTEVPEWMEACVQFAVEQDLVRRCQDVLADPVRSRAWAEAAFERFSLVRCRPDDGLRQS
jgi:hypothetical protein